MRTPEQSYAVLRVALRNAILRVKGTSVTDVSLLFRQIESGQIGVAEATDKLALKLVIGDR